MSKINIQPTFHKRKDDLPETAGYSVSDLLEDSGSGSILGEIANLSIPVGLFVVKPNVKKMKNSHETMKIHNTSTIIDDKIYDMLKNKIVLSNNNHSNSKSKKETRKKRSNETKTKTKTKTTRKTTRKV